MSCDHVNFGGFLERGRITDVSEDGYTVESLDRKGIISPPLGTLGILGQTFSVNDMVLFVLFHDGTGKIISKA